MTRNKFIAIVIASIVGIWWIIYAGYEYVYKKSITHINSDITTAPLLTSTDSDLVQTALYGSNKLALDRTTYLRDDGQQTIFLPNGSKADDEGKNIISWLTAPQEQSNTTQLLAKQASLYVQGDRFIIYNGAKITDHLAIHNAQTTTSWDDLIVTAKPDTDPKQKSIILVTKTNDTNYVIEDNDNWFSEGLYMVAKNNYTIFDITRNDDLANPRLTYRHDADTYDLNAYIGNIAAPKRTQLVYESLYMSAQTKPLVYHVDFSDASPADNKALIAAVREKTNEGVAQTLPKFISSFTQLQPNSSGEYMFTTTDSARQGILVVSHAHTHLTTILTNIAFAPAIADESNEYQPYIKSIDTPYEIKDDSVRSDLEKILGTGGFIMEWPKRFVYKIQPKQTYSGTLTVTSVFWQTATVPLSLYIDQIDQRVVTKEVLANDTISILPSDWSFQDVLIQHQNIGNFPVEFQACEFSEKMGNGTQGWLENQLFTCSGKVYTQQVTTKDFRYWKAYRTAISLPKDFPANIPFQVTIPNSAKFEQWNSSHLFVKSDIGIRAKIHEKKLSVRWFTFSNNKPITDGKITVTTLNGKTIATETSTQWPRTIALPLDKDGNVVSEPLLVRIAANGSNSFAIVHPYGQSDRWKKDAPQWLRINSFLDPADVVTSNTNINFRWDTQTVKVYGYSDRWLYKAGETIYFAGFVRDLTQFDNLNYLQSWSVSVDISDVQGNSIYSNMNIPLDEFGGFKWSAPIPTALQLGDAMITYSYSKSSVTYSHNIKIQEYQKPTFFTDITYENKDNNINLILKPQYFFGQAVDGYDTSVTWSIAGKDSCAYCRWWNQDSYYYNFTFNDTISTGGSFKLYKQGNSTNQKLFSSDLLQQKWYQYTLKAEVTVRDSKSDEVQFFTKYIDFQPDVKIGLDGQPYQWIYDAWSKNPQNDKLEGEIAKGKDLINKVQYEVYYWSYDDQTTENGIDGNVYYLNGMNYKKITGGDLPVQNNFSIKTSFITKAGSYFVRVFATDKNNTVIGEVQKQIEYYKATDSEDGLLWALPNNYALTVSIPKKTYEEWDTIPVDIAPYQKWAHVIMTVERWDRIVDTIEKELDGSQLTLTVKKWYAPNIIINVMQVVGTDKSIGARKEPRFYVWYGQADISTAMHTLNVDIKTDKDTYKPGDTVTMKITTTDSKWKPVDARLSIGVVDQALISLYDLIKEPIPYFFNKVGTSVFNYTNMKLLYQSLRAFANNGSKWWGGNGWQAMFSMIRDDLEDTAFWRWWVITKDGKAELTFVLPDNLTTWVADVIGITKDTRLGTARKTFISTKDLVIEPNPPQFMTLGDTIDLPVKIIVSPSSLKKNKKISGSAKITNAQWEIINLGNFSAEANSKVTIPVSIPNSRTASSYVKLEIAGEYDNNKDATIITIPVRSEWLTMRDSVGVINTAGDHTFSMPDNFGSTLSVSLSTLPTNLIDPIIQSVLLSSDGSTEELLSNALVIKSAYDLHAARWINSTLLQWDNVITDEWVRNIPSHINDILSQIMARQQSDGSFGWWNKTQTPPSTGKYMLTTYTYGALLTLSSMANNPAAVKDALAKAEAYLWNYRTTSHTAFLRYLSQKAAAWVALTSREVTELNAINPLTTTYGWLLRYTIAVYQKDIAGATKRKEFATIPTNNDRDETSIFINQVTAYAIKTHAIFLDTKSTQEDRMNALQNLLGSRTKQGDRWVSNSNVQALKAISVITNDNRPTRETITCRVSIGDTAQTVTVKRDQISTINESSTAQNLAVSWSCDSPVIADTSVTYMPKKLQDQLGASQHVTQMNYSIANPKAAIGEVTTMIGSWTTTMAGEQVVVSIYLPSTHKLLDTILSKNSPAAMMPWEMNSVPFDMSDDRCMPTHRETKYDKLFLYYSTLPAITCDVSIPVIKAYNGKTTIMPMTVSEMFKGKINGRKVILQ